MENENKNMESKNDENKNNEEAIGIKFDPNDPQSLYFLSSSDSPSNIICPMSLNGNNYPYWRHLTINTLKSKNKIAFVNGTISKPKNISPEVHDWKRCNSMVIA